MCVAEGPKGEGSDGDDKDGAVADFGGGAGEEHDVAGHHERCRANEEDGTFVNLGGDEGYDEGGDGSDDVWRDGAELLMHDGLARVDGFHDGGGEEGQTLNGDVVKQEDDGGGEDDGVEDATENFLVVHLVEHRGRAHTFGLDTCTGQDLLLGGQPACRLRSVSEGDVGDEGQTDGNDTFNGEDHPPAGHTAKAVQGEDTRGEKTTECAGQRCHDDVHGQAEGQLLATIPSTQVVGDTGKHTGLEQAQDEAHAAYLCLVVDESTCHGSNTKAEGDAGDEPARTKVFAGEVRWDLEDDVADVEDGQHEVVVVSDQLQVFLETRQTCISWYKHTNTLSAHA